MLSPSNKNSETFVLVHGGWFGGWCWRGVADKLRALGHTVFTPTLTGLGERSHLASRQVTLKTHAQDIANVLIYEDLQNVILLGHSYSGMPLTLVPELVRERIKQLIYLDAFVPQNGQCLADLVEVPVKQAAEIPWLAPPPPLSRWHVDDPSIAALIGPRLTPQIVSNQTERVAFNESNPLPSTYISLTRNQKSHFIKTAERLKKLPHWQIINLDAGHLVMIEDPDLLVDCLQSILN